MNYTLLRIVSAVERSDKSAIESLRAHPIFTEAINHDLIKDRHEDNGGVCISPRGEAWLRFMSDTPFPVLKWVLPDDKE